MATFRFSSDDSFSATWQRLYSHAILEVDNSRLLERISEARRAIYDRAEEVLTDPSDEERRALSSALRTLLILEEVAKQQRSEASSILPR